VPLLTDSTVDLVIAGNVAPFNLPGVGDVGDAIPPGLEANGGMTLNVLDVVALSDEALGDPQGIVGDPIPGRENPLIPSARLVLAGVLPADRTLHRDTVYELHGTLIVPGGVKLTIDPGTRIEGDVGTRGALSVRRGARLDARGTRLRPIVF